MKSAKGSRLQRERATKEQEFQLVSVPLFLAALVFDFLSIFSPSLMPHHAMLLLIYSIFRVRFSWTDSTRQNKPKKVIAQTISVTLGSETVMFSQSAKLSAQFNLIPKTMQQRREIVKSVLGPPAGLTRNQLQQLKSDVSASSMSSLISSYCSRMCLFDFCAIIR